MKRTIFIFFCRIFKIGIIFLLINFLFLHSVFAKTVEEKEARGFVGSMAAIVYSAAWPTATYESWEIKSFSPLYNGLDVLVKLSGKSAFGGKLWLEIMFEFRDGTFHDIRVVNHNAILMKPFVTSITIAGITVKLAEEYSKDHQSVSDTTATPSYETNRTSQSCSSEGWCICNKSSESKVWVAIAYKDNNGWVRKGWYEIAKNECSNILSVLNYKYVYYYAQGNSKKWYGDNQICVHPTKKFTYRSSTCSGEYKAYPFRKVDTNDLSSWTTNLVD
jgi:uncharacterized membrane protein